MHLGLRRTTEGICDAGGDASEYTLREKA